MMSERTQICGFGIPRRKFGPGQNHTPDSALMLQPSVLSGTRYLRTHYCDSDNTGPPLPSVHFHGKLLNFLLQRSESSRIRPTLPSPSPAATTSCNNFSEVAPPPQPELLRAARHLSHWRNAPSNQARPLSLSLARTHSASTSTYITCPMPRSLPHSRRKMRSY